MLRLLDVINKNKPFAECIFKIFEKYITDTVCPELDFFIYPLGFVCIKQLAKNDAKQFGFVSVFICIIYHFGQNVPQNHLLILNLENNMYSLNRNKKYIIVLLFSNCLFTSLDVKN